MLSKRIKGQFLQSAKEIGNHLNSEVYRKHRPEKAFIIWHKDARFGKAGELEFLDGQKDGGIDALIGVSGKLFVIQSKYEVKPKLSLVKRSEIADFEKIASYFKESKAEDDFNNWLQTIRPEIANRYRIIRKKVQKDPGNVRFIFITSKRFGLPKGELVEVEDIQQISFLWQLYREGFTPPAEVINLKLDSVWYYSSDDDDFKTYVGLADVKDFLNLMQYDKNERLFAQNVRTDLHSRINKEIRQTYEDEADRFWLGNNGELYRMQKSQC